MKEKGKIVKKTSLNIQGMAVKKPTFNNNIKEKRTQLK